MSERAAGNVGWEIPNWQVKGVEPCYVDWECASSGSFVLSPMQAFSMFKPLMFRSMGKKSNL